MTAEQKHYAWDRLVRATVRAEFGNLSVAQREDIADALASNDVALTAALAKFMAGKLTKEEAAASLKANCVSGFNPATYRAALAPPVSTSVQTDAALSALLNG
jgi:hypothetical protein